MKPTKAVPERAVVQRINRKLQNKGSKLLTATRIKDGGRLLENLELGRYYVKDLKNNAVIQTHVNLETMARELGVLGAGEEMESAQAQEKENPGES